MDTTTRELDPPQIAAPRDLAGMAMAEGELRASVAKTIGSRFSSLPWVRLGCTGNVQRIRRQRTSLFHECPSRLSLSLSEKLVVPSLPFDFRDDLDVEWAGHPNWYFRISKFSLPYLKHEAVPKTWFLDQLGSVPDDLQNYALKPLYSFAGLGVIIAPKEADIRAIPEEKKHEYILQERLHFEPVIATPHGGTKAEVRMMYVWGDRLMPVLTIVRTGRGLQMGVDHNRNLEWVGASAGLY